MSYTHQIKSNYDIRSKKFVINQPGNGKSIAQLPDKISIIFSDDISDFALSYVKINATVLNLSDKINTRQSQHDSASYPPHILAQLKGASTTVLNSEARILINQEIAELRSQKAKLENDQLKIFFNLIEFIANSLAILPHYLEQLSSEENRILAIFQQQIIKHSANFLRNTNKHQKKVDLMNAKKNKNKENAMEIDQTLTLSDVKKLIANAHAKDSKSKSKGKAPVYPPKTKAKPKIAEAPKHSSTKTKPVHDRTPSGKTPERTTKKRTSFH